MDRLYKNRWKLLLYGFFGVCATIVNMAVYSAARRLGAANVPATIGAWLSSAAFAFVTNRRFVFGGRGKALREMRKFFVCRSLTGFLDAAVMFVAVDMMHLSPTLWKLLSNIFVVFANYFLSKLYVFN